jgi:parvulin-like peptidyl-prolyl isomerase
MKKRFLSVICAIVLFCCVGCGSKKGVAAKVNGDKIMISEVEKMIERYMLVNKKIDTTFETPQGLLLENMRKQFLDGLIDKKIILRKATELKIFVSDSELIDKVEALRKENSLVSDSLFSAYLNEMSVSETEFRSNIKDIMTLEKVRDKYFSDVAVSPDEALAYYNENGSKYARESMKASHILFRLPAKDLPEKGMLTITTRLSRSRPSLKGEALVKAAEAESLKIIEKAESILKEIKSGKPFDALAKKYSEDASSSNGGDIGLFGRGDMVDAFDSAAFTLKEGDVSGIVRSIFGLHIIKALSSPNKEVRPFDEVKKSISEEIGQEKRKNMLKRLRDSSKIEIVWDYKETSK